MTNQTTFLGKLLVSALCLLLIISIGFNVYLYNTHHAEKKNNIHMSNYYISEHEVIFSNVFAMAGSTDIMAYIQNPDHLSKIIEGIQSAEFNYLAASKYATNKSGFIESQHLISNGYLTKLRAYRQYLESHRDSDYEDLKQLAIDMDDLQTISSWLVKKHKNNDFEVYTDKDFYEEVYVHLKSEVKRYYFMGWQPIHD